MSGFVQPGRPLTIMRNTLDGKEPPRSSAAFLPRRSPKMTSRAKVSKFPRHEDSPLAGEPRIRLFKSAIDGLFHRWWGSELGAGFYDDAAAD